MKISNPVLRGFNADPSIVRVGDTYYIANSTFDWFPGVRLHESKDLVHWKLLPGALNRTSQINMRGNPSSGGVWAPDLSYADGKFWLVYADVKVVNGAFKDCTNYLVTTEDIHGPWSEPIRLNGIGFDASLFHDTDGKKYLVQQTWDFREWHHPFDGITLTEYDPQAQRLLPDTRRTIWRGTDVKLVEGPHLYKRDGYYYLFCAEGGTVYTHQEVVARSQSLYADSFEGMPGNPFLTNFDSPRSYLQKQGHGQLVETPEGESYYASLCARPWHHENESFTDPRGWCTLGRETSIQKVEWDADGWPRIVGGRAGERYVEAPRGTAELSEEELASGKYEGAPVFTDDFTSPELGSEWNTQRVPFTEAMGKTGEGMLTLYGQGSLCNPFDLSLVARRWQAFDFDASVCVDFDPTNYWQMAGLTNYYNNYCWSWAYVTWDEKRGTRVLDVAQNDFSGYTTYLRDNAVVIPNDVDRVYLRTKVRTQSYRYEYSFDNFEWHDLGVELDAMILSDDYVNRNYGGFFTGAFVGMACVDLSGLRLSANFSDFRYDELLQDEQC